MNSALLRARQQHVGACRRALAEHIRTCRECGDGGRDDLWIHIDCPDGAACYGEYWQARALHEQSLGELAQARTIEAMAAANKFE